MTPKHTFPLDAAYATARGTGKLSLDELEELFEEVDIPEDERTYGETDLIRFEDPASSIIAWLWDRPKAEQITWINNFLQYTVDHFATSASFATKALAICNELSLHAAVRDELRAKWDDLLADAADPEISVF